MGDSKKRPQWLFEGSPGSAQGDGTLHFSDFTEISDAFMEGYARLTDLGLPQQTIALAMLSAAINVYEMFGMRDELPEILRNLANKIEESNLAH